MANLNRVLFIGRLTREPELRYTPDGTPVANFTIAVNRSFANQKGEREADFIPIVVWRKQAEQCAEYLSKGSEVVVDGRLQIRSYEDRDGIKRKKSEVVAWGVQFLGRFKKEEPSPEEPVEAEIDKVTMDEGEQEEGSDSFDEET
ncbi:single-stranded DNA-binding protein [Candidatus Aerophobetes bacterium]|uniref:Single-stranded DNA-binding protein n=1 Tax=Aerophobetes bacterium TaxID=2030807 RepID=A0A523W9X7_UNCAE|nr:single-stranded DNA-binding protein [Candidatus Aerophobetes bacterium]TET63781.1 MAG: single-stranded DNA-binding protein [Candidatus Aerophobetes bacterium]